jgi:hypothetical protein
VIGLCRHAQIIATYLDVEEVWFVGGEVNTSKTGKYHTKAIFDGERFAKFVIIF